MSLRRLLGLSAAVSGRLRRSLSTAASHPPWAMVNRISLALESPPVRATCELAEPPRGSNLLIPAHFINTSDVPDPDSDIDQRFFGMVSAASGDGLLLLTFWDARTKSPILAQQGGKQVRHRTNEFVAGHVPDHTYLVCNPLSGQVHRVPDIGGATKILREHRMGILAQADRGRGPPDRFAVAVLYAENNMVRFLSETGEWGLVRGAPYEHPLKRTVMPFSETLACGGRLWWVDVSCGALSVDPFSDRTDTRFVELELPKGSVLPAGEYGGVKAREELNRYRRMGVSEGRLRFAEVSQQEPFVLSSFALDEEGGGWTLEHRVALSRVLADGDLPHPWLPLEGGKTPQIAVLDPLNADVLHLNVGKHVAAVDMRVGKVIGSSLFSCGYLGYVPCVLPPWLGSSRIPSTGFL